MQKLIALLVLALSSVTLHAEFGTPDGEWLFGQADVDPITGLQTGVCLYRGGVYGIGRGVPLNNGQLAGANLSRVDLRESSIFNSDFAGVNFSGSSFRGAFLYNNNFQGADLSGVDFVGVQSQLNFGKPSALPAGWECAGGYFIGPGANLVGADLAGADLAGADLAGADLVGADLAGADLVGANLVGADLAGADLAGADLVGADLVGADLSGADLSRADLGEADLSEADLAGADLVGADLNGIINVGAIFDTPDPRIAELEAQLAAVTAERDAAISERDARPTLAEVQDARAGSLVFRADEETNFVTLEFEIQSSENLQDWVAQPEKVTATLPLDAEKKFVRIALAQE